MLRFGKKMTRIRLSPFQIPYPISPFYLLQFDCLVFSSFFQKQDFLGVRHVYVTSFPVANQSRLVTLRFCIQYAERVKRGPNLRFPPFTYILGTMRFAAPRLYAFGPLAAVFSLFCFRFLVFSWSLNNLLLQTLCIFWAFFEIVDLQRLVLIFN